jgi:AraC-like DNA-binding protein
VARWQVPPERLLQGLALTREALVEPEARIPVSTMVTLIERARSLTGEPGIGYYLGLQTRVSVHGYLGFAAMTSSSLREAIALAMRYSPIRSTAISLRLQEDDASAALVIDEHVDFGSARDVIISSFMVGLWQIGCALLGRTLQGRAEFSFAEPVYFARFSHLVPPVLFGAPAHRLVFERGLLDERVGLADPAAQRLALQQCEQALAALGFDDRLRERVRALVVCREGEARSRATRVRSVAEVARTLSVSERTLKRRLAAEGTSYSEILDGERKQLAMLLMQRDGRSLLEVADALGYSDVANFTRAFRRWTGTTPAAYRRARPRPR